MSLCRFTCTLLMLALLTSPLTLFSMPRDQMIIKESIVYPTEEDFDCHSSSLVEISPGVLCAAWKGGPGKGQSNVDMKQNVGIWLSFFKDGEWNGPKQIVGVPDSVCWTPVLMKHPNGELLLFYRVGPDPRRAASMCKRSFDNGETWGKEELMPAGIIGPTRSKPLIDSEGKMICGSSVEVGEPDDEYKATACWVETYSDHQWSKSGPIEIPGKRFGCIEPVLFWDIHGTLKLVCRDRSNRIKSEGWVWMAESEDGGKSWSALRKTDLPNPDSGIEVVMLGDNRILMLYNHSHTKRYPLSMAISKDGGNSWSRLCDLEEKCGEFPSAIVDSQGHLHVTYAWTATGKTQRQVKHIIVDLDLV